MPSSRAPVYVVTHVNLQDVGRNGVDSVVFRDLSDARGHLLAEVREHYAGWTSEDYPDGDVRAEDYGESVTVWLTGGECRMDLALSHVEWNIDWSGEEGL